MEAMRDAWTDERLDDLADRTDRGFDRVDMDIRELRAETKSEFTALRGEMNERFDKVDARFEGIDARFDRVDDRFDGVYARFEKMDSRLDSIQRTIAMGAIAMSAAFLAGFAALGGILAAGL